MINSSQRARAMFERRLSDMRADFPDVLDEDLAYEAIRGMEPEVTPQAYAELCRTTLGYVPHKPKPTPPAPEPLTPEQQARVDARMATRINGRRKI